MRWRTLLRTGLRVAAAFALVLLPAFVRGQEAGAPGAPPPQEASAQAKVAGVRLPEVGGVPLAGRPGSLEVSGGLHWVAPSALGESTATLTPSSGSRYTYFQASARMGGAAALDARVTYNLTRRFALEGGALIGRPAVMVTVADDAEGATGFTAAAERLWQYVFDAAVLVFPRPLTFAGGRGRGFVAAGGGYLRQLHAGSYSVDSGAVYTAGGGVKYYFRRARRGLVKGFGLRADLRAQYRQGGFSFDDGNAWMASFGGAAIVGF